MSGARPTPAALAAKAFLARVDNNTYRQVIENRALLGGWAGARRAGLRDAQVSDAVVMGALDALWELFGEWAAECDDAGLATSSPTGMGVPLRGMHVDPAQIPATLMEPSMEAGQPPRKTGDQ